MKGTFLVLLFAGSVAALSSSAFAYEIRYNGNVNWGTWSPVLKKCVKDADDKEGKLFIYEESTQLTRPRWDGESSLLKTEEQRTIPSIVATRGLTKKECLDILKGR